MKMMLGVSNKHNPITAELLQTLQNLEELKGYTAVIVKASHKEGRDGRLFSELTLEGDGCSFPIKMWDTATSKHKLDECVEYRSVVEISLKRKDWEDNYTLNIITIKVREDLNADDANYGVRRLLDKKVFNIEGYVSMIKDPIIKAICEYFWNVYGEMLKVHPAGAKVHHDFKEGWLEHTIEVISGGVTLITAPTSPYKEKFTPKQLDRYICMALFHDAGKLFEMNSQGEYTSWGKAVGHVYLSTSMFNNAMANVGTNLNNEDYLIILNGIVGHSGQVEWGAIKPPLSIEANLLHLMDMYSLHVSKFIGYVMNPPPLEGDLMVYDYSKKQDYFIDKEMKTWKRRELE